MLSVAVPLNVGVVSFDGVGTAFSVTVGERVSTTKWTSLLLPDGLPRELFCSATAVYSCTPSASAGLACPEVQPPPVPVAPALATGEPSAFEPG